VLYREPLYLAIASDHRLAAKSEIQRADLANESVLALGPAYQLHNLVVGVCEELGAKVRFEYEGTSLDTLREMVAMGMGVTFLPGLYVRTALLRDTSIKVMRLQGRSLYRTVGMAWRKSSARDNTFELIASFSRESVCAEFEDFRIAA
jgi:LysR family hydrogen peroxide-inducible transcriptional activator